MVTRFFRPKRGGGQFASVHCYAFAAAIILRQLYVVNTAVVSAVDVQDSHGLDRVMDMYDRYVHVCNVHASAALALEASHTHSL